MGNKYRELSEFRDTVKLLTTKITRLEAELAVAQSNSLPDLTKRSEPYPRYFEGAIAPPRC